MFGYDKINLTFSFNSAYFIIGLILLAAYAVYVYKYTVPAITPALKTWLIVLRSLALVLLLFIVFEPILTLVKKNIIEPVNLVFVDNSKSISVKDGQNKTDQVKSVLNSLGASGIFDFSELKGFGSKIINIHRDSLGKINFADNSTNFSKIFSDLKKEDKNIASIVIVSDGIITEGNNPVFSAEKLGIPVFTVSVGDTTAKNDIEIKNIAVNEFVYAENPTTVLVSVGSKGFANQNIKMTFAEDGITQEQKVVTLSADGSQNVNLSYLPKTGGEKKLSFSIEPLNGENNKNNNKKVTFVNVLKNKIKVLLVAGSPSADLSFIKNTLEADKNLSVSTITQISSNKFLENNNRNKLIDSCQILYLIGFPSAETSADILGKIKNSIEQKNKSVFFVASASTDYNKLRGLQGSLPFTIGRIAGGFYEVQPELKDAGIQSPIVQTDNPNANELWNNLPPIYKPNTELKARPEAQVLSSVKVNNVAINNPLILSRRLGNHRSIAVLGKDIWKWKLQSSQKNIDIFDRFILNGAKWLNAKENQKQVQIRTTKKVYAKNELVEFTAQVYDESFNPVSNAKVNVEIKTGSEKYNIGLTSAGDGMYDGTFQTYASGDYSFNGMAATDGKTLGYDSGKFNVGDVDVELLNTRTDAEFLSLLANQTNGKYYTAGNLSDLYDRLKKIKSESSKEKITTDEINLWSDNRLMIFIILLFGMEWFFRKRAGML